MDLSACVRRSLSPSLSLSLSLSPLLSVSGVQPACCLFLSCVVFFLSFFFFGSKFLFALKSSASVFDSPDSEDDGGGGGGRRGRREEGKRRGRMAICGMTLTRARTRAAAHSPHDDDDLSLCPTDQPLARSTVHLISSHRTTQHCCALEQPAPPRLVPLRSHSHLLSRWRTST